MSTLRDPAAALQCLSNLASRTNVKENTVNLLRALVQFAPTLRGRENISEEIYLCRSSETGDIDVSKLDQLADRYYTGLIILMAAQGGKTPKVTEHPSRAAAEFDAEISAALLTEAKCNSVVQARRRDRCRSLMSGKIDAVAYENSLAHDVDSEILELAVTEAAHILPFSLSTGTSDERELKRKGAIWEVLTRFSGFNLLERLGGSNINRLGNVLTLTIFEHNYFGSLKCWFEAIEGRPNTYRVDARRALPGIYPMGREVTFTSTDSMLELPDPQYLAVHAACAKVTHASGMGAYVDRVMRDMEDMSVLPEDGCSDVLTFALNRVSVYERGIVALLNS